MHHEDHGHGHHDHDAFFFGTFFYPGFSYPFYYPYWGFDYGPDYYYSPYYYYGYYPYVYGPRVTTGTPPAYSYYDVGPDYYLSPGYNSGLSAALDDIRSAWVNKDANLILVHLDTSQQVAVYLNGSYSYSLPSSDYGTMTRDAIAHLNTVSFSFYKTMRRSDGAYVAYGTHEFDDQSGSRKVVYVSYTLAQINGNWVIVATGSSNNRLG